MTPLDHEDLEIVDGGSGLILLWMPLGVVEAAAAMAEQLSTSNE